MLNTDSITGLIIVISLAVTYTLLEKKYKWMRMGGLYRELYWQNFLINFLVIGFFYLASSYLF